MSDNKIMLELLKEVRTEQREQGRSISEMKVDTARNADSLEEHMRRTDALEQLHKDNEERIEVLEEPGMVRRHIKKVIIGAGAIAAAIYAVIRLIGVL